MAPVDYDLLKKGLKNSKVVTPSDGDEYHEGLKRWSNASVKLAAALAFLQSDEDVSHTVKFACQHKIDIAVRGGGHSTSGASSVEGGLVIDLSRMRRVVVDPVTRTVTAQGGALWEDVDRETIKHGLACVGGTVNHTGVGGLTLGGGYGWLSGRHGLVVDNLLWVRMVLADGRIVVASKDENQELFWAVRGAGSCFGVAVEFCYQAHPAPKHVSTGAFMYTGDKLDAVVDYLNHAQKNLLDSDCGFVFGMVTPPPHRATTLMVLVVVLNKPHAQAAEKFSGLLALEPVVNTFKEVPYVEMNTQLNFVSMHGSRRLLHGSSDRPPFSKALFRKALEKYESFVKEYESLSDCGVAWEIMPFSKVCEVPVTATAVTMREDSVNVVVLGKWEDAAHDTTVRTWAREMGRMIKAEGNPNSQFIAYANTHTAELRARELFGVNYPRLVELKKKFDPENMFRSWHNLLAGCDEK
ncbi:6-hydroxy-D-nicotine oxidase [Escovopsis weberi]|uniref:6-hydroxy-D-nicotine oxidase n=1 Tax=Escovopsis weberi TaxID=150374 RepID=A0A0M9VUY1_ESCWE|nr:6-hydroxy-D-nicotine oxidase [Escovopsis weberi]